MVVCVESDGNNCLNGIGRNLLHIAWEMFSIGLIFLCTPVEMGRNEQVPGVILMLLGYPLY